MSQVGRNASSSIRAPWVSVEAFDQMNRRWSQCRFAYLSSSTPTHAAPGRSSRSRFREPGPSPRRRTQFAPAKADAARDAARFGGQQLHDRQRRHALARARSADDGDHLAGMHVEGHAANQRPPIALRQKGGCEVVDGEDRRVARGRVVASLRGRQCRPLGPPAGTCADVGMQASSMSPPLRLPGPSSRTRYEAR